MRTIIFNLQRLFFFNQFQFREGIEDTLLDFQDKVSEGINSGKMVSVVSFFLYTIYSKDF